MSGSWTCNTCREEKPDSEYYLKGSKRHPHRYRSAICKPCDRARVKARNRPSSEVVAYYEKHPERFLLRNARKRATQWNLPFSITEADIIIPDVCPVLGIPLSRGRPLSNSPSLDRIIPHLGYVPGNVCVISHRANTIKSDATLDELRRLVAYMETSR